MVEPRIDLREQAGVLAIVEGFDGSWHLAADLIEAAGGALALLEGARGGLDEAETKTAAILARNVGADAIDRWEQFLEERLAVGDVALLTVSDEGYPANLRAIFNRPPFLWVQGELRPEDRQSIAIVGTRTASERGLAIAGKIARELSEAGVTVVSGLAKGIDTAGHTAALDAGGRTVAVIGHGIDQKIYPAENRPLAERIVDSGQGAVISQFWPSAPGRPQNFLMRNVVTSGMSIGTLVVEASETSGAKSQARHALEHGKRLFLVNSLVMNEDWAKKAAERAGTTVVEHTDDITKVLVEVAQQGEQLTLI